MIINNFNLYREPVMRAKIVKRKHSIEFYIKEIDTTRDRKIEQKFTDILTSLLQANKLDYILDRKVK